MTRHAPALLLIAAAAILAYLPALTQPLLEDDWPNIAQARVYGPASGWSELAGDRVFRVRATTYLLTHWIDSAFGLAAPAYYAAGILLHVIGCWLIYALGSWRMVGFPAAFFAAFFFAIHEGHQEAVMWYSASNELLLFVFGFGGFVCWVRFVEAEKYRWPWYGASLLLFVLALASKESSVVLLPLMALPVLWERERRGRLKWLWPHAAFGMLYAWSIFGAQGESFRFQDGSFSLAAPFWITWPNSFVRLLWIWGLVALAAIVVWRLPRRLPWFAIAWMMLALLPYVFLTYTPRVPSRQTYLASAGLALLVGAGLAEAQRRWSRPMLAGLLVVLLAHNIGILWVRKRAQFLERARPTEELIALARRTTGPIRVQCFPRQRLVAEEAVRLAAGKPAGSLLWTDEEARGKTIGARFCVEERGR